MPLIPRYSTIDTAAVASTGQFVNGSSEWLSNCEGLLDLIAACDILHAELTWFAAFDQLSHGEPVYWAHEKRVNLHTPSGEYQLAAQDCWTYVSKKQACQLICTADVTFQIREWASGAYSLHIPSWNHCTEIKQCGWALHVIMKHSSLPLQYIQLAAGHERIHYQKSYSRILRGFCLPRSNMHIKLWLCASKNQFIIGKAGTYYSVCSQMQETSPLPATAGLRQYELSLNRTDTSIQEQLIYVLSARDKAAHSELYTVAVQFDCSGALIRASLQAIDGCEGKEELKTVDTVYYSLQLYNAGDRAAERIYVTIYLSEGASLLEQYIHVQDSFHNCISVSSKSGMLIIPSLAQGDTVTIAFAAGIQENKLTQDQMMCIASVTYNPAAPSDMYRVRVLSNEVTFSAVIAASPLSGQICNQAMLTNNYDKNDSCRIIKGAAYKNKTKTYVHDVRASLHKYVNTLIAIPGEIICLYHRLENQGNITIDHVWFADPLPSQLHWIRSSVRIDGTPAPLANPISGFRLHRIMAGGKTYVSLMAEVGDLAANLLVSNKSWASYSTVYDNCSLRNYDTKLSNMACIMVQATLLDMCMSVDRECAQPGEQLTFTFILRNAALVPLEEIHFIHPLPVPLTFLSGSLRIDGKAYVCSNALELHLGMLHPGCSRVISYRCLVSEVPVTGWIANSAEAEYIYPSHNRTHQMKRRTCSNTIHNYIYHGCMFVRAASSHRYITLGEELVIEVAVSNAGTAIADQVWFSTTIPEGLPIVSGSVQVNGELWPKVCPVRGFYIGTIFPRTTALISFRIIANGVPRTKSFIIQAEAAYRYRLPKFCECKQRTSKANPLLIHAIPNLSNCCIPLAKNGNQPAKLIMKLSSEHKVVKCGQPNRYTLVICNIGHFSAEQVSIVFPLPTGVRLIRAWRAEQNDMRRLAPTSAHQIKIEHIHSGESVTVRYEVEADTPPVPNCFMYTATALYQIQSHSLAVGAKTNKAYSNSAMTLIQYVDLEVHTTVNKAAAAVGDALRFRTIIYNIGTVDARFLCVQDLIASHKWALSESESFQPIVGAEHTPLHSSELCLQCLEPGAAIIVYHEAKISAQPHSALLRNQVQVHYTCHKKDEKDSSHNARSNEVFVHLYNHALQFSTQFAAPAHQNKRNALLTVSIMNVGGGTAYNLVLNLPAQAKLRDTSTGTAMLAASGIVPSLSNPFMLPVLHIGQTVSVDLSIHIPDNLAALSVYHDIMKHIAASYHYQYDINPMGYWEQMKIMPYPEQNEGFM